MREASHGEIRSQLGLSVCTYYGGWVQLQQQKQTTTTTQWVDRRQASLAPDARRERERPRPIDGQEVIGDAATAVARQPRAS